MWSQKNPPPQQAHTDITVSPQSLKHKKAIQKRNHNDGGIINGTPTPVASKVSQRRFYAELPLMQLV
jgi:hypothetical protein